MTIDSAPADSSPEASRSLAPPSWPWRRAALFLAGAAQLITISALVSADPIAAAWSSLLAVAPAPLAAAAFASGAGESAGRGGRDRGPGRGHRRAAHPYRLFFLPALVVLAVGAVKLWREQVSSAGEGVSR
jgi:hypothetical protein